MKAKLSRGESMMRETQEKLSLAQVGVHPNP
jgi:hypothetical protein